MATVGVGNLTPQEAANRAERWFSARVEYATGKIKIYPKDPEQPMVVIADRWGNGTDRLNAVKRLQRAGLDVVNGQTPPDSLIKADGRSVDAHLTQKIEIPIDNDNHNREDAPVPVADPTRNGSPSPAAMPTKTIVPGNQRESVETLLGMLVEADQRITVLTERVDRLYEMEHQNRGRYAALSRRVKAAEDGMVAARPPMTEAERAEAERAEITARAIELLESLPPAAQMTAGSIAASLGMPEKGNLLGKLLVTAAKEGKVTATKMGVQNIYRAVPKDES